MNDYMLTLAHSQATADADEIAPDPGFVRIA